MHTRAEMAHSVTRRSQGLALLGLLLAVLASLGTTVHGDHHSLGSDRSGSSTLLVAAHHEPDPTLHLESVTEVRKLSCPGCQLQQQTGGSHLVTSQGLDRPAVAGRPAAYPLDSPIARFLSSAPSRAPPSC